MSIRFPDVPFVQGVPPILRNLAAPIEAQNLLDAGDNTEGSSADDWGIFDKDGMRVLTPDSIVSIERGLEYRISDYPTEEGGFQSYNKVATPFEVRLTMAKGGTVEERTSFLNDLDQIHASLDRYDVSTPEKVYAGVNVTRVSQARTTQSGASMAVVEVLLQEVRQTVSVAYSTATSNDPPSLESQASPGAANASATPKAVTRVTPKLTANTTRASSAVAAVSQGNVQPKPVTVQGAHVETTASGAKLYVYDRPIGSVK